MLRNQKKKEEKWVQREPKEVEMRRMEHFKQGQNQSGLTLKIWGIALAQSDVLKWETRHSLTKMV